MQRRTTRMIDIQAEAAKLRMFRGRTPQTSFARRQGTATVLGPYRDGMLLLAKSDGTGHWETHPQDELLYVLDGAMTIDVLGQGRVQSFEVVSSTGQNVFAALNAVSQLLLHKFSKDSDPARPATSPVALPRRR